MPSKLKGMPSHINNLLKTGWIRVVTNMGISNSQGLRKRNIQKLIDRAKNNNFEALLIRKPISYSAKSIFDVKSAEADISSGSHWVSFKLEIQTRTSDKSTVIDEIADNILNNLSSFLGKGQTVYVSANFVDSSEKPHLDPSAYDNPVKVEACVIFEGVQP